MYYESLACHLHRLGKTLFVVLPNKAKKFTEYQGIKTKTDSVDSYALAWMGCADLRLRPWVPPSDTPRSLKHDTHGACLEQIENLHKGAT